MSKTTVRTPKDIATVLSISDKRVRTALRAVYRAGGNVGTTHNHGKGWIWTTDKAFDTAIAAVAMFYNLPVPERA